MIRFEANPHGPQTSRGKSQSIPLAANIERLYESRNKKTSLQSQSQSQPNNNAQQNEATRENDKLTTDVNNQENKIQQSKVAKPRSADKENVPRNKSNNNNNNQGKETAENAKPKMWIRPQSAQATRSASIKKRTDPVALYQEYQKDWDRFKNNICESSRSDLRWQIREKMANRQT